MKKVIYVCIALLFLSGCTGSIKSGVASLQEGNYQEASELFQQEINKGKHLQEAYYGLGIAYFEQEKYEKAAAAFESALEHGVAKSAQLYSFLGACYLESNDGEKSLEYYEKALSENGLTDEMEQEIQWNIIAVYEDMGNWEKAKKQLETYQKLYPEDSRIEKEAEFLETR